MSETFQRQWSPPVGGGQTKQISDSDSPNPGSSHSWCACNTHTEGMDRMYSSRSRVQLCLEGATSFPQGVIEELILEK